MEQIPRIAAVIESPPGPRQRLQELIAKTQAIDTDPEATEREIFELALKHPGIFVADIVSENENAPRKFDRRSALHFLLRCRHTMNIETFEAVYAASPTAIHSTDSWGDYALMEFLSTCPNLQHPEDKKRRDADWFDLLKAIISKSNAQLAVCDKYITPIMKAVEVGCKQEIVQYLIDHHPGDPFREQSRFQKTLLATIVRKSDCYTPAFVQYIFDGFPGAIRVQETDKSQSTVLHEACQRGNEDVARLVLTAYPEGASVMARYKEFPLQQLVGVPGYYLPGRRAEILKKNKSLTTMVALANPTAIFSATYKKNSSPSTFSPFSALSRDIIPQNDKDRARGRSQDQLSSDDAEAIWSYLFLLMNIYRFRDQANLAEAWNRPRHPVHMAASCPCASEFLLHMANSHPDYLLQYDDEGRSVLALALESGHCFGTRMEDDNDVDDCIVKLVQVDPRVLGIRDQKTGLLPFMAAASQESRIAGMTILDDAFADEKNSYGAKLTRKSREAAPLACLNTVYFLLQADPSNLFGYRPSRNGSKERQYADISE